MTSGFIQVISLNSAVKYLYKVIDKNTRLKSTVLSVLKVSN